MIWLLVPNKGVEFGRMIADLSMKKTTNRHGPNYRIPPEWCRIPHMPTIRRIRRRIAKLLRRKGSLKMWTIDVKSFFLNFGIRLDCRIDLGLQWENMHYRYTRPPFGLRSCCAE